MEQLLIAQKKRLKLRKLAFFIKLLLFAAYSINLTYSLDRQSNLSSVEVGPWLSLVLIILVGAAAFSTLKDDCRQEQWWVTGIAIWFVIDLITNLYNVLSAEVYYTELGSEVLLSGLAIVICIARIIQLAGVRKDEALVAKTLAERK